MTGPEVLVVPTGTANTASVLAGLARAGARPRLSSQAGEVESAAFLVLPGVGAMAAALERIQADGLRQALLDRVERQAPTLAICLGLQLLCESSQESPGARGLGVMAGRVRRFAGPVRVPQMGWNRVTPDPACRLLEPGWAYFANSYRLAEPPAGWAVALADHGGPFVAAAERGAVLACQFHPELSGSWGQALLRRWLLQSGPAGVPC